MFIHATSHRFLLLQNDDQSTVVLTSLKKMVIKVDVRLLSCIFCSFFPSPIFDKVSHDS